MWDMCSRNNNGAWFHIFSHDGLDPVSYKKITHEKGKHSRDEISYTKMRGVTKGDVVDNDRTELSRRIWSDIDAAEQMTVKEVVTTYSEAMESIRDGEADVIVDIPRHFTRDLVTGNPEIDISANGVNATKGILGSQYAGQSVAGTLNAYRAEEGMPIPDANISAVYKYNPTLNFKNFMIPGLMVVLIIIICGFLPAINIVEEKQTGTIEAMNVTPVSHIHSITMQ